MKGACLMKEIQMKNFRSLEDTELQTLSPITILVGENSSGKSTFLRAFPLIKQSISKRTSGPILWAGDIDDYVDFGSFEETVTNNGAKDIAFGFSFFVNEHDIMGRHYSYDIIHEESVVSPSKIKVHYEMKIASEKGKDYVSELTIKVNSFQVIFNLIDKTLSTNGGLTYCVPKQKASQKSLEQEERVYYGFFRRYCRSFGFELPEIDTLWKSLFENASPKKYPRRDEHLLTDISVTLGSKLIKCEYVDTNHDEDPSKAGTVKKLFEYFKQANALVQEDTTGRAAEIFKLCFAYDCFSIIDDYIYMYFKQVHYIAPLRATAERYYRLRNLAVDEVDYQGKNLPIFINSLTHSQLEKFQAWTDEHFGFMIDIDKSRGHLSLRIKLRNSDKKINLSDTGFGYSQVLPIITQLWELSALQKNAASRYYSISDPLPLVIAIEQPELHLHPAIQARLAKAFIACIDLARKNKRELQLIIETHSETIVNYFGRAISRGDLKPEDVSVIMFEKRAGDSTTSVRNSSYDEDGFLTNWPYGFFDSED